MRRLFLFLGILMLSVSVSFAGTSVKKAQKYYDKAVEYFQAGKFAKAESKLLKAIDKDPNFSEAYLLLAKTYAKTGQIDKCQQYASKAYDLSGGKNAEAIELMYELAAYNKDKKGMEKYGLELLKLKGQNASRAEIGRMEQLAIQYFQTGNMKKAEEIYEEIMKAKPDYTYAYLNLGKIYIAMKDYNKARSILERGIAAGVDNEEIDFILASMYCNEFKEYKKAIPLLEKLIKNNSKFKKDAYSYLINACKETESIDKGIDVCENFIKEYPEDKLTPEVKKRLEQFKKVKESQKTKK
ncbi:hypothetical protein TTHT_1679 [Thermotomaculum hydrothermale]|uniref:Tetratricopeptide repeat protein n=1 Tax=Thermotomaculum hydrothermale TaxID=981385 RepID=A0A7R6PN68_9BACT|nr:tetratricopeptide repeat protein [Thermotomaculum hydrothermale]BBB33157.1 hypothetical protein TTHT_1679 [Thermotomaculum hydrothermale]